MALVSVIIPTRNRSALLKEAIESVLAVCRDGFELEVLVVDNGSTDDTATTAAAYPVRYLSIGAQGASAARNAGLAAASGNYIAFLDDDDLWLPNNIAPQLQAFREHPEYGAVFAQTQLTDEHNVPYGDPVPEGPLSSGWIFDDMLYYWPQLGAVVVRAGVAREIGDFDRSLQSEEEWDWLLRIAQRYQIGRVQVPVMLFRQRGYGDEAVAWRRLPDTIKVFHRHTRRFSIQSRVRLQKIIWGHRGWYAANFIYSARHHASSGARLRALRCLRYALATSPAHAVLVLVRSLRAGPHPGVAP
jgi:glycosyltransferase involved in cell wall biosynthesis